MIIVQDCELLTLNLTHEKECSPLPLKPYDENLGVTKIIVAQFLSEVSFGQAILAERANFVHSWKPAT